MLKRKANTLYRFSILFTLINSTLCHAHINNSNLPQALQAPFLCQNQAGGLGNPIVDNKTNGTPVYDSGGHLLGYSLFCGSNTQVSYLYKPKNQDAYVALPQKDGHYTYPSDLDQTQNGYKYIVRIEKGTINRFMYVIAILKDPVANLPVSKSGYNGKLIYNFAGGVGLGHTQSSVPAAATIKDPHQLTTDIDPITMGYAVVYSTGTASSTQYNLKLGLTTAQLLKQAFVDEFGAPIMTIGYGGSGGSIQQFIYSQYNPTLLDGIISTATFPDLLTQVTYGSDCSLLEYYFDNLAPDAPTPWAKRELFEGLSASENMPAAQIGLDNPKTAAIRHNGLGSDTCVNSWMGRMPDALNPTYGMVPGIDVIKVKHPTHWTLWANESNQWISGTYPTDRNGFTPNTVDNEGVQYGLVALKAGKISKEDFIDLNAKIGGWKPVQDFQKEPYYPFADPTKKVYAGWSADNATAKGAGAIAKRKTANIAALKAAEQSGLILSGNLNKPILDVRLYTNDKGDIHTALASFMLRARLQRYHYDKNQVIWVIQKNQSRTLQTQRQRLNSSNVDLSFLLTMMDQWVTNIQQNPNTPVAKNKPSNLQDTCISTKGFFSGDNVWDGIVDPSLPPGKCTQVIPVNSTSRIAAGEALTSQDLKCELIPFTQFVLLGGYGNVIFSTEQFATLNALFVSGVCHYGATTAVKPLPNYPGTVISLK